MGRLLLSIWLGVQSALALHAATLISGKTNPSVTGAGGSFGPTFSPDGRYLTYQSYADNLVTNDSEGLYLDLFVYDFITGKTRLISDGSGGSPGQSGSAGYPTFSSNAAFAAFSTFARLAPGDTNFVSDVYLRDLERGTNLFVTLQSGLPPFTVQTIGYARPLLSADATKIVFESTDKQLLLRLLGQTTNIALHVGFPIRSGPASAIRPSMTPDARRVAFLTSNFDLWPYRSSAYYSMDVFVRDAQAAATYWVSSELTNAFPNNFGYQCINAVISSDGTVVAYKAAPYVGSTNAWVFRYDLLTGQTVVLSRNNFPWYSPPDTTVALSADGRFAAFERNGQIHLYDAETGTNSVVSVQPSGQPATGVSFRPVLTPDGTVLSFCSTARDLVDPPVTGTNFQIYVKDLTTGITRLASFNTNGQPSLAGARDAVVSLSPNGLRVAFDYVGSDLVARDHNSDSDVFVYDWNSNSMELISRRHSDLPSSTGSWGTVGELSMSGDGGLLAYSAYDDASVAGDQNGVRDAFLVGLSAGQIAPLFARSNQFSGIQFVQPLLSSDGQAALVLEQTREGPFLEEGYVQRLFWCHLPSGEGHEVDPDAEFGPGIVFSRSMRVAISPHGNLVAYEKSGPFYFREMPSGASRLAVKNRSAIAPFGEMLSPLFSPDQRWFIFQYNGTDLVAQPLSTQGRYLLYARDLHSPDVQSNATYLVSPATAPSVAGITRSFSATGDLMAYDSLYYAPVRYGEIRVFDFRALQNLSICSNCARPSLSADGRLVAYTSWRTNGNDTHGDVYVQDRIGGTRALISRNSSSGQPANGPSENPLITANGRYVVFTSRASDLVSSDTNAVQDLFVRDRYRGITYLLSATASGLSADGRSRRPVASSDGLTIAFQSYAGNLVPGDYNHALDIFVVRLGAGDSDLDGLDDAWEITYFDDLTRDGSGDSDTDGQTDLHEYISGTDPTNAGSHLEVISIQPSPNSVRLMWSSVPGKEYQIQIRASLSAGAWQNLSSVVRATTTQTSWSHSRTNYAAQSYYRAALVQ